MARKRTTPTHGFAAARRTLDGLQFFRKVLAGEVPRAPMLALLKMTLLEVEEGRVVFGAIPTAAHYNGWGVAHGGFAATLLDSALGCAINTMAPTGKLFTTVELKINFTRPLTALVGPVRCEGKVIHMGGRVATSEARIVDQQGKLYAHATTTCLMLDAPAQVVRPHRRRRGRSGKADT